MSRFEDAPLEEGKFRLFKIKPNKKDIQIEVQTFKFWRAPKYEAISYTWGEKSDGTTTILCNGKPLEVWQNLHSALSRLQNEKNTSWLWNDAICIEQTGEIGTVEKARQIAFMETIFSAAEPVRIWLGQASKEEEKAFEHLANICRKKAAADEPGFDISGMPDKGDKIWLQWAQIMLRPWFARLWVVQEGMLTSEIVVTLGKKAHIPWKAFLDMVERTKNVPWYDNYVKYKELDSQARKTVKRDFLAQHEVPLTSEHFNRDQAASQVIFRNYVNIQELSFLNKYASRILDDGFFQQVLKVYGNRRCAYNQDRPNAMRGLLSKDLKKDLKVYTTDDDTATVYQEVTRLWLKNDPTLSLLQRVRPQKRFLPNRDSATASRLNNPSWTIDLERVLTDSLASDSPNKNDGFHAGLVRQTLRSGKYQWSIPSSGLRSMIKGSGNVTFPTDKQLQVSGLLIGSVKAVCKPVKEYRMDLTSPNATDQHVQDFCRWIDETYRLVRDAISDKEQAIDAHWRTLVQNRAETKSAQVKTLSDIDNNYSRKKEYDMLLSVLHRGRTNQLSKTHDSVKRYYNQIYIFQQSSSNWFSLKNGLVGRSFAVPKSGDVIGIFYGAATPFLLRPVPGHSTYYFMGEAYVHNIMQGEALEDKDLYRKHKFVLI